MEACEEMTCPGSSSEAPSGSPLEQVKLKGLPFPDSQFPGVGSRCLYFSYAVLWSPPVPDLRMGSPGPRRFCVFALSSVGVGWSFSPWGPRSREKLVVMSILTTRMERSGSAVPSLQILGPLPV